MRVLNIILIIAVVALTAALVTVLCRKADTPQPPSGSREPVAVMAKRLAKGDGISEDEAKTIALEACRRLWGVPPSMKVEECKLDDQKRFWVVFLWKDHELAGWGCRMWINRGGGVEKAELVLGA